MHALGKDHTKTHREDNYLPAKETGLGETKPADIQILNFQPQNCEKIAFFCLSTPACGRYLVMTALASQHTFLLAS